jgi:Type III restriction enzyme, res subunit/Helicase conserved C-terminal domain
MNPLEKMKDRLKIKPTLEERVGVEIVVGGPKKEEQSIQKVTIREDIDKDYQREALKEKLKASKLSKVSIKIPAKEAIDKKVKSIAPEFQGKTKPKKISKKLTLILEEEEDEGKAEEDGEEEIIVAAPSKKRGRKTEKAVKGVAELGPEEYVQIGDAPLTDRIHPKQPNVGYKVSSYYMNNREIFVNFINSLFEPYKREFESDAADISCDNIGRGAENFSLLTHQKIVRDYLNLYTPYRGLLLFHGLGSGKTASSIAIAEGMKNSKRVIIMTPASLRRNYMEELKKAGDFMYKKNQFWSWISTEKHPEQIDTLSAILSLPVEYIKRKKGAWLINIKQPSNYASLTSQDKKSLDDQLDEMIQTKYTFINYNGLRATRLKELTNNYEKNLFDNAVIIIDEAHNFISRIVNKLGKEKEIEANSRGEKEIMPRALSLKLYHLLQDAKDARVVLLTGTPIINYPNEIGVLFNILRGYIKTWEIQLDVKTNKKVTSDSLHELLLRDKNLDYLDYSPASGKLYITRNPLGFKNKIKESSGYLGVTNEKKDASGKHVFDMETISDYDFERRLIGHLKKNDIEVVANSVKIHNYTSLPDKLDNFITRFIDPVTKSVINVESFKRRIIGLTSYFRSAQEDLLPRYEKTPEYYHVIKVPMSDYQFKIYEAARREERKMEKSSKKKQGGFDKDGIYKDATSTYRIFSRLFCNFVMPVPPGRPMPRDTREVQDLGNLIKDADKEESKQDLDAENEGELEGDAALNAIGDTTYMERIENAIQEVRSKSSEYLSPEGLQTYSPKFLHILENISDAEYRGLHLVYSQFRTLEGIGLFTMVLEANGFAQFKLVKNLSGVWEIRIKEADIGKPTFALYTGTESAEEKEIIRNIYNGDWDFIPTYLADKLREIARNNNMGEIIKVFMITSSGSEGINLRNTRYVHIMEPYWHPVRTEQVIGRARRICSHKDLPPELQSVEVFLYLMTFTQEQIQGGDSIELKLKDLSKREPKIPLTSDEALYEISSIKEEVNTQLIKAIKESAIDCAIYSSGSKENLQCLNFGEPTNAKFAYNPSISADQTDVVAALNKTKVEWSAKSITIYGIKYAARKMNEQLYNIYDLKSYQDAKTSGGNPILIGTLEIDDRGKKIFKTIVV